MLSDFRFALRQLRNRPGFSTATILVLALGLGASTSVFSVLYETLLKPLPYTDASRIVFFHNSFPNSQAGLAGVSTLDYVEIRRHKEIFSETGIYFFNDLTMTGAGAARHVDPVNVSASFFGVLGVKAALGRVITEEDDRYGAPKVAVLSDALWRNAFDANPAALGRVIQLDDEPYTIVGVMPPAFQFPYPATQLWLPLALPPAALGERGRIDKWLQMIGRIRPGISEQQAKSALQAVAHHLAERFPAFYPEASGWHFTMRRMTEERTEAIRIWIVLAFAAVLCVFLIACFNAGGLLLTRWRERSSELAIRAALGAGQSRIVRQILTETALLAGAGCLAGVALASWAVRLFDRYGPVAPNARVEFFAAAFAVLMAVIATIAAGFAPALLTLRMPIEQALKTGATRAATRATGWRSTLIAAQVASAVILVSSAILLSRSFVKLMDVPPGFVPQRVWSGAIALSRREYRTEDADLQFFQALQKEVATLPGVERVSAATAPPFNPNGVLTLNVYLPGGAEAASQSKAQGNAVLAGYFETMKIRLLSGRTFRDEDRTRRVLIVDQEFVREYFPHQDPIGQMVGIGGERDRPSRIVGVVDNVVNRELSGPRSAEIYWPDPEEMSSSMYLLVRTKNDTDIAAAVRSKIRKLNPNVALFDVAWMDARIAQSMKVRRFLAALLNGFAGIGLLLAGLGLYGSLAYLVHSKRREIGIRMALGAAWHDVIRPVVVQAAAVTGIGLAIGVFCAAAVASLIRNQLFGVGVYDPLTWAGVLSILAVTAICAIWLPALRATRVEPVEALREE